MWQTFKLPLFQSNSGFIDREERPRLKLSFYKVLFSGVHS